MKLFFLAVSSFLFVLLQGGELVKYAGSLAGIMKENDVSSKINLNEIKNKKNLYALGAAENLKGEIQIFNGTPFNSEIENKKLVIKNSFDKGAALLVYANVKDWKEKTITTEIVNLKLLEDKIELIANQSGIDTEKPFPFLINTNVKKLAWHVVDTILVNASNSHEEHESAGIKGEVIDEPVEIIGFYSKNHKGIFTHHSTNIHVHFKDNTSVVAGHVDELSLKKNTKLFLPQTKN